MKHGILTGLKTTLEGITTSGGSAATINDVRLLRRGTVYSEPHEYPVIEIEEAGDEEKLVVDPTDIRWGASLLLRLLTEDNESASHRNDVMEAVKLKIEQSTASLIDPDLLSIAVDTITAVEIAADQSASVISVDCQYVQNYASVGAGADHVYSTVETLEGLLKEVNTELGLLKTALVSLDTKFDFIYDTHSKAKLQLNAVSFEIESGDLQYKTNDPAQEATDNIITISFRVHTNYMGRAHDPRKNARLCDSLHSWFKEHRNMGNSYRLWRTENLTINEEFNDSMTTGGEITISFQKFTLHSQA